MARNAGWLWGLVPLALLWASANVLKTEPVRRDIEARALAANAVAGAASGARGVSVRVSGRDVYLDGEAVTADGASKALAQLQSEFGVRRVLGGLTQVIAQKPYSWSATRQANLVTLSGFVPDEATATASVSAARALGPELRVDDQQKVAFGAPPGFAELAGSLMRDLGQLSAGKVALDDTRYCVEGTAATPQNFLALRESASTAAPKGFTRVDCALSPPIVAPYRWSAEKSASGSITITGFYPSDSARREIAALLARAFPAPGAVTDRMLPAAGEPAAFAAKVTRAVADLVRLRSGKVEIEGAAYRISGQGPENYEACEALKLNIAQGDGPDSVALASIVCPPPPPPAPKNEPTPAPVPPAGSGASRQPTPTDPAAPSSAAVTEPPALPQPAPPVAAGYGFTASIDRSGGYLTGYLPDAAAKEAIAALIEASPLRGRVNDETEIQPAAPTGFGVAARAVVLNLLRLDLGSASVVGREITIRGLTCRALIRDEVETDLASGPPQGFSGKAEIGMRQTGCVIDPASTCQNELDALTQRYYVIFALGTGVTTLDPVTERAMTEAAAILKQCPNTRVTIEGHTNFDGERSGFNNLELSNRRAQRVREELVRRGVAATQLEVKGYGTDRPLVVPTDPEARIKNRRVQFTVAK
ncbi:OmpA family protein [Bosea sp. LjRoot237]|uniref:OmpA family protein n=1 Tax=Bosea sp. LjRoot237 TaxID=3342292 RepID=UPI003ED01175